MSDSRFQQWLAARKQATFLIPILLLAMAFAVAVLVGKQSAPQGTTGDAFLVIRSGVQVHSFEINLDAIVDD